MALMLHLTGDESADALLSESPLALLIGMLLDQQVPIERAFAAPSLLVERLDEPFDARSIATLDPDYLDALFREPPALHRYPGNMARRTQELCQYLVNVYDGNAAAVWQRATNGAELYRAIAALPGFGKQKAQVFIALLGKQLGVTPPGWREYAGTYGEPGYRSVADVIDRESLDRVRAYKRAHRQPS